MKMEKYRDDFIGQKFGRLTIIEFDSYTTREKIRHSRWLCRCDCGNTVVVKRGSLTSGNTKSCGCFARELTIQRNTSHLKTDQLTAFHKLYSVYKGSATRRELEFSLSEDDVKHLTKMNCFYCGLEPSTIIKSKWGEYIYNGIDRMDNRFGYVMYNCVPCCERCNKAKSSMSVKEFREWINRLLEHQSVIREPFGIYEAVYHNWLWKGAKP